MSPSSHIPITTNPTFPSFFFSTLQYATIPLTCRAVALRVESSYHASFVATWIRNIYTTSIYHFPTGTGEMEKGRRDHSCCVLFLLICSFCYCLYQYYKHPETRKTVPDYAILSFPILFLSFHWFVSLLCMHAWYATLPSVCLCSIGFVGFFRTRFVWICKK